MGLTYAEGKGDAETDPKQFLLDFATGTTFDDLTDQFGRDPAMKQAVIDNGH